MIDISVEKSDDVRINIHGFNPGQMEKLPGDIETKGESTWKKMDLSNSCQIVFFQGD